MSARIRDVALVALLAITAVLAVWAMRPPAPVPDVPAGTTSTSRTQAPTPSAQPDPTTASTTVAVFLGDSFAEGRGASAPSRRFTSLLSTRMGWSEENRAHAGTGYLRSGKTNACDGAPCKPYADQLAGLAALGPGIVVVSGGANDMGLPASDVSQAVQRTLAAITQAVPDAKLVVVNPWWDNRPMPKDLAARSQEIATAARQVGASYVDLGQPLRDNPRLLTTGGEANDQGHAFLADQLEPKLTSLLRQ